MNKYQQAYEVIDTILHLMCGEEREDGYKPTQDEMIRAMNDFKELVDKQTLTLPDVQGDGEWNGKIVYDTWICPNCGEMYEIDCDEYKYCPNCGQHIDRSELEKLEG